MKRLILILLIVLIAITTYFFFKQAPKRNESETPETTVATLSTGLLIEDCYDIGYITKEADIIVEGVVEKTESKWNNEQDNIETNTTLKIFNTSGGDNFPGNTLQIVSLGGCVDEICQAVEGERKFFVDERISVYLQKIDDSFWVVCGDMGIKTLRVGILDPTDF